MRILYVTTVPGTMKFFLAHFKVLIEEGHTIELACNCGYNIPDSIHELGSVIHNIPFSRSPFSRGNIAAIKELKNLVKANKYDIVHTHTPNASACVRLACRNLRKHGLKVFYTAHGFHFYKGAPLKNWLIYYPVEWLLAHWTDKLITINQEDYTLAQKCMHAKEVLYLPGVGIDLTRFGGSAMDKDRKRKELDIPINATLLISVGELNKNKNHEIVIKAIKDMDVHYIIVGNGDKREYLQNLIDDEGLTGRVKLLGYRSDVKDLYITSDIFAFPSFREGLSVALMEAMASGLPCVVSRIRGNIDLIDENGGALFDPHSVEECRNAINKVLSNNSVKFDAYNANKIRQFGNLNVLEEIKNIYTYENVCR